ncbi:MAG: type VI secretion system baseplate subunit TssF [Gallionellaceae bacterium]|nr:type VI secretion system baseplate subunit TssF [Gallionellaceae bacterium]MDD5367120.1 type VI secretion system baseplate subunit TssF [Gallionellaceae bacterium]
MNPRLLDYYNQELLHIREGAAEFAREFPKIAARLGLDADAKECPDPYVERLLEGFAYLTGRIQLKIDSEFPVFTQNLLEMVYPGYQAPTPAMAIVQFQVDLDEPGLAQGFNLPRQTVLRSRLQPGESTACVFRTAHALTFWPVRLTEARYHGYLPSIAGVDLPRGVRAALSLKLQSTAGLTFRQIALDRLTLHLSGEEATAHKLYEQICANTVGVLIRPGDGKGRWSELLGGEAIQPVGFTDEEALLPQSPRAFGGYRLLKEYSAFPARYLFVDLAGLNAAVARCEGDSLEIMLLLDKADATLEKVVDAGNFVLNAVPVVNLFPKRADRIHLSDSSHECHIVPERTRPMDYEINQVTAVTGYGTGVEALQEFEPFYAIHDQVTTQEGAYYTLRRTPRVLSSNQKLKGPRSSYVGTEVFVSLVNPAQAPYSSELAQISVSTLCSNRDLPLFLSLGNNNDFSLEVAAPVSGVRCIKGPSRPVAPVLEGETPWRLISHLSLNYLSLIDAGPREGAVALREVLGLYGLDLHSPLRKQLEGVQSVGARQIISRIPSASAGPIAFARGVEIQLTFDERPFEGSGIFLLGTVLERFFARHVSLNSFTQTVLHSTSRGEIKRWPVRLGQRQVL